MGPCFVLGEWGAWGGVGGVGWGGVGWGKWCVPRSFPFEAKPKPRKRETSTFGDHRKHVVSVSVWLP